MSIVISFIPWIVYWVLVGNTAFTTAVTIAFALTVLNQLITRIRGGRVYTLDIGNLVVFAVLVVAAYTLPSDVLEKWLSALSNLGLFLIALVGLLLGKPFVREYASAQVDAETAKTGGFKTITLAMTWMWIGAYAIMTISSLVPPIVDGDATLLDMDDTLGIVCYWVIPYVALGIAGAVSATFPPWFEKRNAEVDTRTAGQTPLVPQPAPPSNTPAESGLVIDAPADSRVDEPFGVTVRGVAAGSTVTLSSQGQDLYGRNWRCSAAFPASATGTVEVGSGVPQDGDWNVADPTAPLWAMRFADNDVVPELFVPPTAPWQVTLEVEAGAHTARRTVVRRGGAEGLRFEPTELHGLPGMIVLPAGEVPAGGWPGVACFSGSEGGFESQLGQAAVLASHGNAALAQAWISEADAAAAIAQIPLERFAGALTALADRPEVDASRVSGMAISRGSEGLLAAVSHGLGPALHRLILISPSCVSWQAIGSGGEVPDTESWTLAGQPVPWVPFASGVLMRQLIRNAWEVGRDTARHRPSLLRLRPGYEASLGAVGLPIDDSGTVHGRHRPSPPAGALLDAAAVSCPVLMLCGSDDAVWPSAAMSGVLAAQRRAAGTDGEDERVVYDGAGHLVRFGVLPTDAPWTGGIMLGGTREGLAAAQADATRRVLGFLETGRDRECRHPPRAELQSREEGAVPSG